MNVRICQLCGKPLSRLRVGGDGDFCSKDHRNQFRLRAGMDRLVEVNKVASLMRRRENARQIAPASLICSGALDRRGFLDAQPARIDSTSAVDCGSSAAARVRASPSFSDRCTARRPFAVANGVPSPRTHDGAVPSSPRSRARMVAARQHRVQHGVPRKSAGARCAPSPPQAYARIAISRAATSRDAHAPGLGSGGDRGAGVTAPPPPGRVSFGFARAPVEGNALRVSIGARLPCSAGATSSAAGSR